jgi:hypothetical protein
VAIQARDASGYFTKLAAMVAFACFVLNLVMLGQIFNITPTDRALIPWAALAFLLAYACDLRLLLAAGICCVIAWVAGARRRVGRHLLAACRRAAGELLPGRTAAVRLSVAGRHRRMTRLRPDLPRLRPALPAGADAGAGPLGLGQLSRDNANRHAQSANPAAGTVSTWNFWLASASNRGLPL